jgi:hypothetical protein
MPSNPAGARALVSGPCCERKSPAPGLRPAVKRLRFPNAPPAGCACFCVPETFAYSLALLSLCSRGPCERSHTLRASSVFLTTGVRAGETSVVERSNCPRGMEDEFGAFPATSCAAGDDAFGDFDAFAGGEADNAFGGLGGEWGAEALSCTRAHRAHKQRKSAQGPAQELAHTNYPAPCPIATRPGRARVSVARPYYTLTSSSSAHRSRAQATRQRGGACADPADASGLCWTCIFVRSALRLSDSHGRSITGTREIKS